MPRRTILLFGKFAGRERAPSSKPHQSRLPIGLRMMSFPVALLKKLMPQDRSSTGRFGNLSGTIWTSPPAKSADLSAEYDFAICTLSMRPVGKRSRGTTFLSGSVVGMVEPASVVLL